MVPFDASQVSKTAAGVLAILALALPAAIRSQDAVRPIASLEEAIEAVQLQDGPNSADLIGPLTALGLFYQERREPFRAIAAVRRALEIVRFNYGLHSLEQAPLMRQMIGIAESSGDHATAWDLEQELLRIAARHPDDARIAEILRVTADRRMDVLARYEAGQFPPEVLLGCYYDGPHPVIGAVDVGHERNCMAGTSHRVIEGLVVEAQTYYMQAVNVLLSNERSSEELPPLLRELVQSSYRYGNAALGRRSLSHLLAYEAANPAVWPTWTDTLVQIADWDLLHAVGRNAEEAALAEYVKAYEVLLSTGIGKESIDALFSPGTPIVLPSFLPNPFVNEETKEVTGHLDVMFEIDRSGKARKLRVLGTSENVTRLVEKRLVQLVARARFRPRFVDGRLVDPAPVAVRYDFNAFDDTQTRWPLYWLPTELYGRRVASSTGGVP